MHRRMHARAQTTLKQVETSVHHRLALFHCVVYSHKNVVCQVTAYIINHIFHFILARVETYHQNVQILAQIVFEFLKKYINVI